MPAIFGAATHADPSRRNTIDQICFKRDILLPVTAAMGSARIIRDPIHGFVKLSPWEQDIVGHPVFQRLRHIRQLALTDLVYPGACHTRFEHSLGVMHVATLMFDQLRPQLENVTGVEPSFSRDELDRARLIVRLSALLHDIGHGPFSHAGEDVMQENPRKRRKYRHEDYSTALIRSHLTDIIENHPANNIGVTAADICSFLANEGLPAALLFWRPLITGQIDADRSDYLLRDSYHAGVAYGRYDIDRLIATLRVVHDPETESLMIGVDRGGIQAVEGLILGRYMMFVQVYFHHTRRAYDYHVTRVLAFLLEQQYRRGTFPAPDTLDNLSSYLTWTDTRVWSAIENNAAGRDGVLIRERRHDRVVFETSLFPEAHEWDRLIEITQRLSGLAARVDRADNSWYKFETSADIRIAETDSGIEPRPARLSARSSLVRALKEVTQRRVYVPFEQRAEALALLNS